MSNLVLQPIENPTINLPALLDPQEAMEVMVANLEGLGGQHKFEKVKIPSGGGLSFTIIDETGQENPVTELKGVVLDYYPINAYWGKEYSGENNPPDCSSLDGQTGTGSEEYGIPAGQQCANCRMNQWGSDPKGTKGKACKNIIRVYLLEEESVFPKLIALPPTSTKNWRDYVVRLTNKVKPYYGVITSVKLEKDKSEGGILYSKTTFAKIADLTKEERAAIKQNIDALKPSMRSLAIDAVEYNVEETAADSGSEEQPY